MSDTEQEQAGREPVYLTHWEAAAMPASGAWAQKRRLAAAMRTVIGRLVQSDAPESELREAAERLEGYAQHLAGHPRLLRYEGFAESAVAGDVGAFFDQNPLIGLANPLSPPVSLRTVDERTVQGRVRFGAAYEGPPGCVHGGFIAAAFDEVLGFAQSLSGSPGFTGTLQVRYRNPTPLHTELRFDGRLLRQERRKIFTEGHLYAAEVLCAEAEAIFVSARPERFAQLLEERRRRESRGA